MDFVLNKYLCIQVCWSCIKLVYINILLVCNTRSMIGILLTVPDLTTFYLSFMQIFTIIDFLDPDARHWCFLCCSFICCPPNPISNKESMVKTGCCEKMIRPTIKKKHTFVCITLSGPLSLSHHQGPLSLTLINFNTSMDKQLNTLYNVGWNYLFVPKLQGATVEMWEWLCNFINTLLGMWSLIHDRIKFKPC